MLGPKSGGRSSGHAERPSVALIRGAEARATASFMRLFDGAASTQPRTQAYLSCAST
jgi:hypothetical protein